MNKQYRIDDFSIVLLKRAIEKKIYHDIHLCDVKLYDRLIIKYNYFLDNINQNFNVKMIDSRVLKRMIFIISASSDYVISALEHDLLYYL